MLRLLFSSLARNVWIWLGPFTVITVAGALNTLNVAIVVSADHDGALRMMANVLLILGVLASLIVVDSATALAVSVQRREYALWQLVGVGPRRITAIVVGQLMVLAVIGSSLGSFLMSGMLQPAFDFLLTRPDSVVFKTAVPTAQLPAVAGISVIVLTCLTVLVSGLRGARRAGRVPAIEVLREPDPVAGRMGWFRWTVAGVTLLLLLMTVNNIAGEIENLRLNSGGGSLTTTFVAMGALLAALIAATAPLVVPWLLRMWTSLVPSGASSAWFLARNQAEHGLSMTTAAVAPLMVGIALSGILFTVLGGGDGSNEHTATVLLIGPTILAAIGSAVTIFMSGNARKQELALIQASGGTPKLVVTSALYAAVMYVVTATILGLAITVGCGLTIMWAVSASGFSPESQFAITQALTVAVGGLVLIVAATVLPVLAALRHSPVRVLTEV